VCATGLPGPLACRASNSVGSAVGSRPPCGSYNCVKRGGRSVFLVLPGLTKSQKAKWAIGCGHREPWRAVTPAAVMPGHGSPLHPFPARILHTAGVIPEASCFSLDPVIHSSLQMGNFHQLNCKQLYAWLVKLHEIRINVFASFADQS